MGIGRHRQYLPALVASGVFKMEAASDYAATTTRAFHYHANLKRQSSHEG